MDVKRFKQIPFKSKPGFYKKLFHKSEINYCLKYKNSYEHFAGKFAIKEAVIKSIPDKISMINIETYHVKSKPHVKIKNLKKNYLFQVSLSHENDITVAIVLSELRV